MVDNWFYLKVMFYIIFVIFIVWLFMILVCMSIDFIIVIILGLFCINGVVYV